MSQEAGDYNNKIPDSSSSSSENKQRNEKLYRGLGSRSFLLAGLISAVCVIVFVVYRPALSAKAVSFDDDQYLLINRLVKNPSWESARRFLCEVTRPSTVGGYYQPLTMISLMIDYAVGGREDNFMPFHRTSLIIHIANTALIIVLLYQIFGHIWAAVLVGLLFGVHPLTVETIPWISERKTLLAAFFSLACLNLYVRFTKKENWMLYAGCFLLYVLGMMSKPISTPIPLLMLLMDYWPLKRFSWRKVLEKIPLLIIGGVFIIIIYVSQKNTCFVETPGEYEPVRIPLILCHNIIFYLSKMVWPANLSPHYAFPDTAWLSDPRVLAGIIGTAILIPLLLVSLRWTKAIMTSWLFFFVALLPTMQIIGFTDVIASDKYVYLPSVGLLMLLTSFLIWLCCGDATHKPLVSCKEIILIGLILAGLESIATRQYITYWKDTISLYLHMLKVRPNAVTLNYNFGNLLLQNGKVDEAVDYLRKALKARPDNSDIINNLGVALLTRGNTAEAIPYFQKALEARKNDAETACNLATALMLEGNLPEAINLYRQVLESNPNDVQANSGMGLALWKQGEPNEALEHFYRILSIKPGNPMAHYRAANILKSQGKLNEAVEHYIQALQQMPENVDALCQLSGIMAANPDTAAQAVALAANAARLTEYNDAAVLQTLAIAYAAAGQFDQAVEIARKALNLASISRNEALANSIREMLESFKAQKAK